MIALILVLVAGTFLAFSNGANDNFKGVATLLGSKTASYKVTLLWATVTTLAGSIAALFLAQTLMENFSGKGLVPNDVAHLTSFSVSVGLSAALTVFLATRFGFPISTTHALTGALVGTGLLASPEGVNFGKLTSAFILPLLVSPFLAIAGTVVLYPMMKLFRRKFGVERESCLCIGNEVIAVAPVGLPRGSAAAQVMVDCSPQISVGTKVSCEERYVGEFWGVNAKGALDSAHFLSSGLVSFARGLNDTPKVAAILLIGNSLGSISAITLVTVTIALGGIIYARRIADMMSYQITEMNDGQGFSANLVTGLIVVGASKFGLPVSTTHVSCGSLFGIGAVTRQAHWQSIAKIILAWVTTLPVAGLLGGLAFTLLKGAL